MDPADGRRESFFQHLDESEQRLGSRRYSLFDALFVGLIVLVIAGGLAAGIVRLRAPGMSDQPGAAAPAASPRVVAPEKYPTPPGGSPTK